MKLGLGTGLSYAPLTLSRVSPACTTPPAVSGTAQVGQTLTTTDGAWTNAPSFAYLWVHGDGTAAAATATNVTYVPAAGDIGFTMTCTVTATNASGSASSTSAATAAVVA